MSSMMAAGGIVTIKKLIEQITLDLYANFKGAYTDKIKRIDALSNVDSLHKKIDDVSKVKTIWQTDKAVPLSSFYCDTHIKYQGMRKMIRSISDFGLHGNILIEGIAGQGKSIFLRKLCVTELEEGNVIPVFIELRRITENDSLQSALHIKLKEMGFDIDDTILAFLCETNRIIFLLDGFDEVPEKKQIPLINEIETLTNLYKGLKVIITSRPDSGIEYLPSFNVVKVAYIIENEYKDIVHKLNDDPVSSASLIEQVEKHNSKIKELLCTPMMITLLVLTYKAYQKVPEQLSEFFESMFHLMLQSTAVP